MLATLLSFPLLPWAREPTRSGDGAEYSKAAATAGCSGLCLPWKKFREPQKGSLLSKVGNPTVVNFGNNSKEKQKKISDSQIAIPGPQTKIPKRAGNAPNLKIPKGTAIGRFIDHGRANGCCMYGLKIKC